MPRLLLLLRRLLLRHQASPPSEPRASTRRCVPGRML